MRFAQLITELCKVEKKHVDNDLLGSATTLVLCRLPVKYKLRLTKVMVMFANRVLRASMTLSCPFFSHSFWGKVMFIQRLEDLWQIIEKVLTQLHCSE
jgi:hypothetical protein